MEDQAPAPTAVRFDSFELLVETGELRKDGVRLKLSGQPIQVLSCLVATPGKLVTREELQHKLWPGSSYGDFEKGLNAAVNRLRENLGDSATEPKYIETIPGRGYRFIAHTGKELSNTQGVEFEQPRSRGNRTTRFVGAALLIALSVGALAALYSIYRPRNPVITAVRQLTHTGHQKFGHLVTDGTRLYFDEISEGRSHLAEVSTAGGEIFYLDTQLDHPSVQDISPNGSELLVSTGPSPGSYWIVPLPAGAPQRIPGEFSRSSFLPGSSQVVYLQPSDFLHLFASDIDGGNVHALLQLPRDPVTLHFAISPDGSAIRYDTADGKIWESHIDGTQKHVLSQAFRETNCMDWTAVNKLFLLTSPKEGVSNVWAISGSSWLRGRKPQPVQLTFGPVSFQCAVASRDGKHIYALGRTRRGELSIYDTQAGMFRKYLNGISAGSTDFSPDGQWVAYVTHPQGNLWRSRLDGSDRRQLTSSPMGPILVPKWSPDGRFLAFMEFGVQRKIYLVSADGGAPLLLLSGDFQPADPSWSPDGKFLVYGGDALGMSRNPTKARSEIRIFDLSTKQSKNVPGSQGMFSPRWSPDGRYLVALSDDQKRFWVYSFASQHWQPLALPKQSEGTRVAFPHWSHDSRYLFFVSAPNKIYKVGIPGGQPELIVNVAGIDTAYAGMPWNSWFGLTPDDQILMMLDRGLNEIYALDVDYR